MNVNGVLIVIAACAVAWYIVSTLLIYDALRKRGERPSFIFLRFLILRYASRYREITRAETGRVGPLFYHWVVSINVALLAVVVLLLVGAL